MNQMTAFMLYIDRNYFQNLNILYGFILSSIQPPACLVPGPAQFVRQLTTLAEKNNTVMIKQELKE
ncbi:hypothetical protein V2J09_002494 [Rumex salicifolius]